MQKLIYGLLASLSFSIMLTGCHFHMRGETELAPPMHRLYLQTPDPYGHLARDLEQNLKMSHVQLTASPKEANAILAILDDSENESLLGVSGTQQTRQYRLTVTITFEVTDAKGRTLVPPQSLSENRTLTIQSNQVLGSNNEATLYYQQMRRSLASSIMYRLSSLEVRKMINRAYAPSPAR